MSDTSSNANSKLVGLRDFRKEMRENMLTEAQIFDISIVGYECGLKIKSAVTNGLFGWLYPYAEDANHNITFSDRIEELLLQFKKNYMFSPQTYGEFEMKIRTHVKQVISYDKVNTYSDGKARDRTLKVYAGNMPDEKGNPSLVFGLKSIK